MAGRGHQTDDYAAGFITRCTYWSRPKMKLGLSTWFGYISYNDRLAGFWHHTLPAISCFFNDELNGMGSDVWFEQILPFGPS